MTDADRDRLVRLLGMTGSDSDGEALTAVRMAGKLLAELKLTWADVISLDVAAARDTLRVWQPMGESPVERMHRMTEEAVHTTLERLAVRTARARLDQILARQSAPLTLSRAHFEAIRVHHQQTGYINPTHRAQIDRQFFKAGWDSPLAPDAGESKIDADHPKAIDEA